MSRDPDARLAAASAFDDAPPAWQVVLCDAVPAAADVVVWGADVAPEPVRVPALRFDPDDPAGLLEAVRAVGAARGRTTVVTSAGGGAGVTTIALHLARAGSALRAGVTVVAALDSAGTAYRLGLEDALGSTEAMTVAGGFRVLLGPGAGWGGDTAALAASLRALRAEYDRVILDVPGPLLDAAVAAADLGVCVVTPTVVGARRARALLERYDQLRWGVVTNRTGHGGEAMRSQLERILGRRISLELPCSPALRDAEDECRLLATPFNRWHRRVVRLARALERS